MTDTMPRRLRSYGDALLLTALILAPRLFQLGLFLTPDEPLFLEHARQFWHGLTSGNFSQTLGIGYPGVTVAAVAAWPVSLATNEMGAYVAGRLAVVLLVTALLLVLYGLTRRLLGRWPAFIGVSLLALDPYTLGYSRLLHIAAPLALLMTLAGISLLLWLREFEIQSTRTGMWSGQRWLLLLGLFSGLALLTKSTALLLGPMLAAAALAWGIATGHWREGRWWARLALGGSAAALLAVVTFAILWPAVWVDPVGAVGLVFGKLFVDQAAGTGNMGDFWFGQFLLNPGPWFYPLSFLLKLTPWLLFGLLGSLYLLIRPGQTQSRQELIALWVFALVYLVIMTIASKKSVRYLLPAFPAFYLITGAAVHYFINWLTTRPQKKTTRLGWAGLAMLSGITVIFAALYHPYYLTYFNPVLLGWRWAPQTVLTGWGEGLDQAAKYLEQQPEGTVSAWYGFLFYIMSPREMVGLRPDDLLTADHTVLYINQVQRDIPGPNIIDYFRNRRQPEHTIRLNGIDYAWVYPGPVAGPTPATTPTTPLAAQYANELQLLGYTLHSPNSPDPLTVTLNWQVLNPPAGERFVFVRLLDAAGRVWASTDSPPVMGLWPPERWQPGMFIEDAQQLPIPAGTPPGAYRLEVGLYNPADGQPLPASGLLPGPGGGLLLGEVTLPWTPVEQFDAPWPVTRNAPLSPNATLVGHTSLPTAATTGDLLALEMGWQNTESLLKFGDIWENYVMFEWRSPGGDRLAEQLDPLPLPIEQWGRGAVLRSRHEVIVPPTLYSGPAQLWAMLHNGSDPAGEAVKLADIDVTAPPHNFDLPAAAQPPAGPAQLSEGQFAATVTLAGYTVVPQADTLTAQLFWQTDAPLTVSYRVFAQIIAPDGTLVAQSDALPAAGQRPTTGWLPGEIITDEHSLTLPPDAPPGQYRLIAGLYQPATGQRLPLSNTPGDAITVAEINK